MSDDVLILKTEGNLATLTLNRPKQFNAFDAELRAAMRDAVKNIEADDTIRIIIIKGEGRGFCAGADLSSGLDKPVDAHIEREYKPFLTGIADSNKIYIAQVHGTAAGIGAALAMNCDFVTMADDATIYMAFAAISLIPDGGNTQLLLQNMGYHRALEAIIEGRKVPAEECLKYGIANKIFNAAELDEQTRKWAEKLSGSAPLAMAAAKRLLRKVGQISFSDTISLEGQEQEPLTNSQDFQAGVAAFFKKEKPVFSGK
ncbi:MAG: enoyl-CoA hydratase [Hyphomicrobiales bacterium]|nr:MAG: enoyl-CoA hydratase [Hyphomicrobiales bacterium]